MRSLIRIFAGRLCPEVCLLWLRLMCHMNRVFKPHTATVHFSLKIRLVISAALQFSNAFNYAFCKPKMVALPESADDLTKLFFH